MLKERYLIGHFNILNTHASIMQRSKIPKLRKKKKKKKTVIEITVTK